MKIDALLRLKGNSVRTVQPWTPVGTAIARLAGPPRVGALVVTGVTHGFTGLLSERDIVAALRRYGVSVVDQPVREVMSQHVPTCAPRDTVATVMMIMTRTKYRHVPVLEQGDLVGIVSIGDLVRARLDEMQLETGVLRDLYWAAHAR